MPRFPFLERLELPALFADYVPGELHTDGRRYLPLLVFRLANGVELGLVDRHHRVAQELVGQPGQIQVVSSLSNIRLQAAGEQQQGFVAQVGRMTTAPAIMGHVLAVPSWEEERGHLAYEYVYTELLVDVGLGTLGVRTAMTADDLTATIGKAQIAVGDWINVSPSRLDILGFQPQANKEVP